MERKRRKTEPENLLRTRANLSLLSPGLPVIPNPVMLVLCYYLDFRLPFIVDRVGCLFPLYHLLHKNPTN